MFTPTASNLTTDTVLTLSPITTASTTDAIIVIVGGPEETDLEQQIREFRLALEDHRAACRAQHLQLRRRRPAAPQMRQAPRRAPWPAVLKSFS